MAFSESVLCVYTRLWQLQCVWLSEAGRKAMEFFYGCADHASDPLLHLDNEFTFFIFQIIFTFSISPPIIHGTKYKSGTTVHVSPGLNTCVYAQDWWSGQHFCLLGRSEKNHDIADGYCPEKENKKTKSEERLKPNYSTGGDWRNVWAGAPIDVIINRKIATRLFFTFFLRYLLSFFLF